MSEIWIEKNNIKFVSFQTFDKGGSVLHGTTSRVGGVSPPPYNELNLGVFSDDKKENVNKNIEIFTQELDIDRKRFIFSRQIHKDQITAVYKEHLDRNRAEDFFIDQNDALVTNVKGIMLAVFSADCPSVSVFDPVRNAIGIAHAGWKGTVLKIAIQMLHKMKLEYGTRPVDCLAAIGPSIKQCCYEISENVVIHIRSVIPYWQDFTEYDSEKKKWKLSLQDANFRQLISAGVKESSIVWSKYCTCCDTDDFFSFRKEGITGRQVAFIMLK